MGRFGAPFLLVKLMSNKKRKAELPEKFIDCPHCRARTQCQVIGSVDLDTNGPPEVVFLLSCRVCASPLLAKSEIEQIGDGPEDWDFITMEMLWPESTDKLSAAIPSLASDSLREARLCFSARAYSSCAVMCGRSIEGLCKHHDPSTRSLDAGLKSLLKNGTIDQRLFEWGQALRVQRNLSAHANIKAVSREDAKDLLDFCFAICEYVFVLNKKFERFKKRQDALESN